VTGTLVTVVGPWYIVGTLVTGTLVTVAGPWYSVASAR